MKNKIVALVIIILVMGTGVLAYFNFKASRVSSSEAEGGTVVICWQDVEVILEREDIEKYPAVEFQATEDTSKSGPEAHSYKGVELKEIINGTVNNSFASTPSKVTVRGIDGYTIAIKYDEIQKDENVYFVFEKDGEPLKSKKKGGNGPYQLIIRGDMFSQRWCKYATEVVIE